MITVEQIPFDVFRRIEHFQDDLKRKSSSVIYNNSAFDNVLVENGYFTLDEKRNEENHSSDRYKFYIPTEKLSNDSEQIIEELTGLSMDEIYKTKLVPLSEVPWDWMNALYELKEANGFTDAIDLGYKNEFRNILYFHGFIHASGPNGVHSYGSEKLKKTDKDVVFQTVTGKTVEEFVEFMKEDIKQKEIKAMLETAKKYGYTIYPPGVIEE